MILGLTLFSLSLKFVLSLLLHQRCKLTNLGIRRAQLYLSPEGTGQLKWCKNLKN